MKKVVLFCCVLLVSLICSPDTNATISYVKGSATGLNNGSSWMDAYTSLQSAAAASADTIWIAAGTYKPTNDTNRSTTFLLNDKKVFGGFAGTETMLSQRDFVLNETVLSGDIGVANDTSDNSQWIVSVHPSGLPGSTVSLLLDGFIVERAARSAIATSGFYPTKTTATFNNCIFRDNYRIPEQYVSGGAVLSVVAHGDYFFNNCLFERNTSTSGAGAIELTGNDIMAAKHYPKASFRDCRFYNNTGTAGGAIFYSGFCSGLSIDRCVFSGNKANNGGCICVGSPFVNPDEIRLSNSAFVRNTAGVNSVMQSNSNFSSLTMTNCTVAGNKSNNGVTINTGSSTKLRNSIIWDNIDSTNTPALSQLVMTTPSSAITNNIIQHNTSITGNFTFNPLFIYPAPAGTSPLNFSDYNYHLNLLSPAINAGIDTLVTTTLDLNNGPRILGGQVDLGCYEQCLSSLSGNISATEDTLFCPSTSVLLTAPAGGNFYLWNNGATTDTIMTNTPGTYVVSITDGQNCVAHFSKQIIDSMPAVIITGDTSLCGISATLLTANGNGRVSTYAWSNGVTTADNPINTPGYYYVIGTSSDGCSVSSDTLHLPFWPLPQPVITPSGATLTTGAFNTYQWMQEQPAGSNSFVNIAGANAQTLSPALAGKFQVKVTSTEGCENVSAAFSFDPLSLHGPDTDAAIRVYPNPAKDQINISLPSKLEDVTYSIYGLFGNVLARETIKNTGTLLKLKLPQHLASGTYFLQLHTPKHNYQAKFVIQK